jgi:CRP-like cAMP-binding protein
MFNEVAVLDEGPNPVTAVAILNSLTWRLPYEEFHSLMNQYPILGTSLLRVLAKRNRELIANYEDVFSRPVQARTAKVLLDLSQNGKKSICRHKHQNPELAARAATVPEAVSRHLGIFKEIGDIDCSRARIIIKHPKHLADVAMVEDIPIN